MYKIVAVEYINTLPFIRAIQNSPYLSSQVELITAEPKLCAQALLNNSADLVLLPVGSFGDFDQLFMQLNYGIACNGSVHTVGIFSNKKWDEMVTIKESNSSRSSNRLLALMNKKYWNSRMNILSHSDSTESDSFLIIGDDAFEAHRSFKYFYDLGELWKEQTGMPFVFAAWMARKKLDIEFIEKLKEAFEQAIQIQSLNALAKSIDKNSEEISDYFKSNIHYSLNNEMLESLVYFYKLNDWKWNIEQ